MRWKEYLICVGQRNLYKEEVEEDKVYYMYKVKELRLSLCRSVVIVCSINIIDIV